MKSLTFVAILLLSLFIIYPQTAFATETKKVCTEVKDQKTGKFKEQCKTITVHKKLEGTKVPDKK
jgi:hypothetical protein